MSLFLVTTALGDYWKQNTPLLFLGKWANPSPDQQNIPVGSQTLDYHWNNRERLRKDYLYIDELSERVLPQLAAELGALHQVTTSVRYWRILLGPWLHLFLSVLYDRYLSIQAAESSGLVTGTWIPPEADSSALVPQDYWELLEMVLNDDYNQALYGLIIRHGGKIPFEERKNAPSETVRRSTKRSPTYKERIRTLLQSVLNLAPVRLTASDKLFTISSSLDHQDQLQLRRALGLPPMIDLVPPPEIGEMTLDRALRSKIKISLGGGFEALAAKLLAEQLPFVHGEGFLQVNRRAKRLFPKKSKVILTATAEYYHEPFKAWCADQVENGAKLIVAQHGGHYGTGLWSGSETHERRIADRYLSWGWSDIDDSQLVPLPSPKLVKGVRQLKPSPKGPLLLALNSFPRYSYRMFSIPIASQALNYLEDQIRFCAALSEPAFRDLVIRPYPADYGWKERERFRQWNPDARITTGGLDFNDQLRQSRLHISSHNTTTYLETMAANFPTILFWNPEHWELRAEAKPYFEELRAARIFHETPESAALWVNSIQESPQQWWQRNDVQRARNNFCQRFANAHGDWVKAWTGLLADLVHSDVS